MEALSTVLEWAQNVAFILIGAWALVRWRRSGDEPSRWLAATFGSLAFAVTVGVVTRDMAPSRALELVQHLNVIIFLPFPYYLLRFLHSFEPVGPWLRRTIAGASAAMVLGTVAVPSLLVESDTPTAFAQAFVLVFIATWAVALGVVAWRFWRAGRAQPTLVRRRLRTLSLASTSLGLAVVLIGADPAEASGLQLAIQLMGLVSAGLFLLGFAPPGVLKAYWRQPEERLLNTASLQLMEATEPQQVADILVPPMRRVIAAQAVALVHDDQLLSRDGSAPEGAPSIDYPLVGGTIHVWVNSYTPFFGEEEKLLLGRMAVLADLALARTDLLASEREARVELESANTELEAFVYSASHDLKSPVIALLSYVDLLAAEYAAGLDDQGRWFLDRMRNNCLYMESLVGDLLELSRVGRVDTAPTVVDLEALVEDVGVEVRQAHPAVTIDVAPLPMLHINELRARQLLRNLLENAASHGRSETVRVEVRAEPSADVEGGVVLFVRDDGVGVPAEYRERVFGVFERLEADADGSSGTGIGLAICRKIAESGGGRIWLTDHDDGAEFAVLLPPASVAPAAAAMNVEEVPA